MLVALDRAAERGIDTDEDLTMQDYSRAIDDVADAFGYMSCTVYVNQLSDDPSLVIKNAAEYRQEEQHDQA